MKEDMYEYLEESKVKDLVKKHSEFIGFPIKLYTENTTQKELTDDEDNDEYEGEDEENPKVEEVYEEEEKSRIRLRRLRRCLITTHFFNRNSES